MVNFTILQVVLLTLLAFIKHVDYYGIPMIFVNYAVFWGLITGVVMGDWKTGLVIGGTIQLMQLGVAGFGGSSIPDYGTMAIIATAYGVTLGSDTGLAIGLPVGMLGIQLDVVAKILNGFVVEKSQKFCNEGKFNQMNAILWVCPALFGLCAALPVFVSVTLGQPAVNWLLEVMPQWFLSGLTLAGVGDSLLMTMIPTIMGSIAAYMAIEGNPVGAGIWFALILAIFWVRMHALEFGYKQGVKLVTDFSEKLPNLTAAASVLGLTVVGCLIASVIGVTCPISFSFGDVAMEIQPLLDKILPAMIPAAITGSAYYLLTKKNASMTALILVVIVLAMVASAAGILA